jgi:hypothetical protein
VNIRRSQVKPRVFCCHFQHLTYVMRHFQQWRSWKWNIEQDFNPWVMSCA